MQALPNKAGKLLFEDITRPPAGGWVFYCSLFNFSYEFIHQVFISFDHVPLFSKLFPTVFNKQRIV
jgi:hypothetical protein